MDIPWTFLKIDGTRPLDRSARGITATYRWIEAGGDIVRLANGARVSLRRPQFRKLAVTVSGRSARKPALDHLGRGDVVTLECPFHIDQPGDVADGLLIRPAVAGSIYRFGQTDGKPVQLAHGAPDIVMTSFRPQLSIMLDEINVDENEQAASVSWSISGEEV